MVEVDKGLKLFPEDVFPVHSRKDRELFEYALQVRVKMMRKEYADFLRAITPLIVELFEEVLKTQCVVDLNQYTYQRRGSARIWDSNKLYNTEILDILNRSYERSGFGFGTIKSDHICNLILHKSSDDDLKNIVRDLRAVEGKVRNMAAHEIVSVDENLINYKQGSVYPTL